MRAVTKYLVSMVSETNCERFLSMYPNVKRMMRMSTGRSILPAYKSFLQNKNTNEAFLGGTPELLSSVAFGSKTFYKYDWCDTTGWAEVFQYLWNKKQSL